MNKTKNDLIEVESSVVDRVYKKYASPPYNIVSARVGRQLKASPGQKDVEVKK